MKNIVKWIIAVIICAAAFAGIYFLYTSLAEKYEPDRFIELDKDPAPESDADSESESADTEGSEETASEFAAPDFTVLDAEGNEAKLSDFFGKPIVLNFWASWCYYCTLEMPDFNEAYHNNPDIQFLMVNVTDGDRETMDIARKYIEDNGYDFPVFYDTTLEAAMTYGASGLPMSFFIDKNGNLVTYAAGMLTAENLAYGISLLQ